MLLDGLFLPLTTPFYLDGRLNLRKLEHNVDRYSKTPAAGFVVLGEHGDPTLLTEQETRDAMHAAISAAIPEKVMLAGISRDSVFATLELAEYAAGLNYDAVLVGVPTMLQGATTANGTKELLTYFQSVADRSPLPVVIASSVAAAVSTEIVIELANHSNILGLVDGGDAEQVAERIAQIKAATVAVKRDVTVTTIFAAVTSRMLALRDTSAGLTFISADTLTDGATALAVAPPKAGLRTRTKTVGFQFVAGSTAAMLAGLKAGATGVMPPFGASAPQGCHEVLAAWKDGDEALAEIKQVRVRAAAERIEGQLGSAGIRYGCDLNGYFGGRPRLPLLPVDGEQRAEIDKLMQGIRN